MIDAAPLNSDFILGMRVDRCEPDEWESKIMHLATNRSSSYICVPNVHLCIITVDNLEFRQVINQADLIVSDSAILESARTILTGHKTTDVLKGDKIMWRLIAAAHKKNVSIGLIGGRTEESLNALIDEVQRKFPGINVGFSYCPPFRELTADERQSVIAGVNNNNVGLLFLGIGGFKQENWMSTHKGEIHAAMIGVGAAFDTISGDVSASPDWVHRNRLEWLYRLAKEPRRLGKRYLLTSPRFLILIAQEYIKGRLSSRSTGS